MTNSLTSQHYVNNQEQRGEEKNNNEIFSQQQQNYQQQLIMQQYQNPKQQQMYQQQYLYAANQQPQLQPPQQYFLPNINAQATYTTNIPQLNPTVNFMNCSTAEQLQQQQLILQTFLLQQQQQQQNALLNAGVHSMNKYPMAIPNYYNPLQQQQQISMVAPSIPRGFPLTVQDRPLIPPIYNGVNTAYPGVKLLNVSPPVYTVDNFLTLSECTFLINAASDSFTPAPVVGAGSGEISKSRTSSTCYLAREDLPILLQKVYNLTGKPWKHTELPQVGRYLNTQQYLQHYDAFDLSNEDGQRFAANGGQRVVTVLIYLNDVEKGGQTNFPMLDIKVQPKMGKALVFFPSTVDGYLDKKALHAALPAVDVKFVSQIWIRQGDYEGFPSKRLNQIMI